MFFLICKALDRGTLSKYPNIDDWYWDSQENWSLN